MLDTKRAFLNERGCGNRGYPDLDERTFAQQDLALIDAYMGLC